MTYPQRQFNVFKSPNFHVLIVSSKLVEIFFVNGKDSSRKYRTSVNSKKLFWIFLNIGILLVYPKERPVHGEVYSGHII